MRAQAWVGFVPDMICLSPTQADPPRKSSAGETRGGKGPGESASPRDLLMFKITRQGSWGRGLSHAPSPECWCRGQRNWELAGPLQTQAVS